MIPINEEDFETSDGLQLNTHGAYRIRRRIVGMDFNLGYTDKVEPDPKPAEEGDFCRNPSGCNGEMVFEVEGGCTCHINPPCHTCVNSQLKCDRCGWKEEDIEY